MAGSRRLLGHGTVQSCDHSSPPQKNKNMQSMKIPLGFVTFHLQPGLF